MSTPVDEEMPTMDRISHKDLWEIPPVLTGHLAGFSSDLPETQKYHVFQRIKLFGETFEPTDPYWTELITAQEFIAASDYYNVERDVAHALRLGGASYARVVRDGLFARLRAYLANYEPVDVEGRNTDQHSLDTAEAIVVGELHCPHVDGVKATFENKVARSEKIGIEVKAGGGGGGGWARELLQATTATMSAAAPDCQLICAHLRGHYVIWEHIDTKERMVLTNITGVHKLFLRSLTGDPAYEDAHLCADPANFARCLKELGSGVSVAKNLMGSLPLARTAGALDPYIEEEEWTTSREYTGHWGSEIDVKGAKLGASVSYTSSFVHTIKVTVELPYGFHYISRYRSARELPQQWVAQRIF